MLNLPNPLLQGESYVWRQYVLRNGRQYAVVYRRMDDIANSFIARHLVLFALMTTDCCYIAQLLRYTQLLLGYLKQPHFHNRIISMRALLATPNRDSMLQKTTFVHQQTACSEVTWNSDDEISMMAYILHAVYNIIISHDICRALHWGALILNLLYRGRQQLILFYLLNTVKFFTIQWRFHLLYEK